MRLRKPNKRMLEYWLDEDEDGKIIPIKMPYKYVIESFCDMAGASKAYNPNNWKPELLWEYWVNRCKGKRLMQQTSERLLEKLLWSYYQMGEKEFFVWYKANRRDLEKAYEEDSLG